MFKVTHLLTGFKTNFENEKARTISIILLLICIFTSATAQYMQQLWAQLSSVCSDRWVQ